LTRVNNLRGAGRYRDGALFLVESTMQQNVGNLDRIVRIVAGLVLIALAATGTTGAWAYIGILPLATGLFRFCPVYRLFGLNTSAR
jgi:hypothetical protein